MTDQERIDALVAEAPELTQDQLRRLAIILRRGTH
jgi:hypothetical protein